MSVPALLRVVLFVAGSSAAAVALAGASPAAAPSGSDVQVSVQRRGPMVIIDVEVPLPVSPEEAWHTLSDYDHMTDFLPNLTESRVLSRNGNELRVAQKGHAERGPLSFAFENVRDVVLVPPTEIRTQLVSGSLRDARSVTRVLPTPTGSTLFNHGEYTPGPLVPVGIAMGMIEDETRKQFTRFRSEIVRRKQANP
jgi:hypothetical protein